MAYIDYPITCIAADSYRENPERGSTLHRAEDGTPWVVNLWPETRYTFEIVHPALSAEEQLELEQFYEQYLGDEVRWFNPRRQNWWRVRMVGPPRLSSMRSGLLGDVDMTLVGEMVDAPTYSVPPVVSGLHQIGQVISVSQGTWQSEYPMQFEYQWLRNGEPIAGATDQNYTLVDSDLFNMISVRVTASSFGGSTSVETEPVRARLDSVVSWLYSDMAETIFVDVDGNTPATWGDPAGLIKDSSGNGNDFTQPTVTARPILGRVPRGGRRNQLGFTEDVSQWRALGDEVSLLGGIDDPGGGATAIRVTGFYGHFRAVLPVQVPYGQPGSLYTTRVWLRTPNSSSVRIYSANVLTEDITLTADWAEYVVTVAREGTDHATAFQIRVRGEGQVVDVWHPQSELGSSPTPYQRVTSQYDVTESGVPEVHYLDFDGTDDLISTEIPAIENGTVVIAGTNGIWIDDDYNFAGGTFSIGPTSYTNGPAGILEVIGDPIVGGSLVINRQLSQQERELVIQELKERGAPGVFELGPELADPSAWSARTPHLVTWLPDGRAEITAVDGTSAFRAGQFLDLIPGRWYTFTVDVEAVTSYTNVRTFSPTWSATTGRVLGDIPQGERRIITGTFQARENEAILGATGPTRLGEKFILGDISVRQLELVP